MKEGNGIWNAKPGSSGFEELRYLLHFAKMVRLKKPEVEKKPAAPAVAPAMRKPRKRPAKAATDAWTLRRKFGQPLQFVENANGESFTTRLRKGLSKVSAFPI